MLQVLPQPAVNIVCLFFQPEMSRSSMDCKFNDNSINQLKCHKVAWIANLMITV